MAEILFDIAALAMIAAVFGFAFWILQADLTWRELTQDAYRRLRPVRESRHVEPAVPGRCLGKLPAETPVPDTGGVDFDYEAM